MTVPSGAVRVPSVAALAATAKVTVPMVFVGGVTVAV